MDLLFWYDHTFGSPVARVQGLGYLQELVSRLTHTPIEVHNSSTNATWHSKETWPLNDALYVDATHEVVVLNSASPRWITRVEVSSSSEVSDDVYPNSHHCAQPYHARPDRSASR